MRDARRDSQENGAKTTNGARGIFERPAKTFEVDPRVIEWILADAANPLNQIAKLIPANAVVLDVGAGNGVLARLFERLGKKIIIDAIEPDPVARALAAASYRSIFPSGLEEYVGATGADRVRYDFIVMADVVEHLADPEPLLRRLKELLSPQGRIILSTPNVAFASVRLALLDGRFDYVDSGILERTHLRFYTLKTLQGLFAAVGLYPSAQFLCLRNPLPEISLAKLQVSPLLLAKLARDRLAFVYQFLFVLGAEPTTQVVRREVGSTSDSIVLEYSLRRAKDFLEKLYRRTRSLLWKN